MAMLFSPIAIRGVEFKNRIMMSPMGTVTADQDGKLSEWQFLHYGARALGQVGLVMLEVTAAEERGADPGSLGLWTAGGSDFTQGQCRYRRERPCAAARSVLAADGCRAAGGNDTGTETVLQSLVFPRVHRRMIRMAILRPGKL